MAEALPRVVPDSFRRVIDQFARDRSNPRHRSTVFVISSYPQLAPRSLRLARLGRELTRTARCLTARRFEVGDLARIEALAIGGIAGAVHAEGVMGSWVTATIPHAWSRCGLLIPLDPTRAVDEYDTPAPNACIIHSQSLRARTGSVRVAFQAGRKHAASAATVITRNAAPNASGSRGLVL